MQRLTYICLTGFMICILAACQEGSHQINNTTGEILPLVEAVDAQPLVEQVKRLTQKLAFLGSPLSDETVSQLEQAYDITDKKLQIRKIQEIMDPLCLNRPPDQP